MRKIKDADYPNLRPERDYVMADTWDSVVDDEDLMFLLKKHTDNVGAFLKEKQDNIYGVWREGKVPAWVMRRCDLEEDHLRPLDVANLAEHNAREKVAQERAMSQHNHRRDDNGAFAENFNMNGDGNKDA